MGDTPSTWQQLRRGLTANPGWSAARRRWLMAAVWLAPALVQLAFGPRHLAPVWLALTAVSLLAGGAALLGSSGRPWPLLLYATAAAIAVFVIGRPVLLSIQQIQVNLAPGCDATVGIDQSAASRQSADHRRSGRLPGPGIVGEPEVRATLPGEFWSYTLAGGLILVPYLVEDPPAAGESSDWYPGIVAYHAETGDVRWHWRANVVRGPVEANGTFYAWTDELFGSGLTALDLTGNVLWRFRHPVGPLAALEGSQLVYVYSPTTTFGPFSLGSPGQLIALDRQTGNRCWHVALDDLSRFPSILPTEDTIVVFDSDSQGYQQLIAIDASTGQIRWQNADRFYYSYTGGGRPLVTGGTVYAMVRGGHLVALDARTGQPNWQFTFSVDRPHEAALSLADETIYLLFKDDHLLIALDPATGIERWRRPVAIGVSLVAGNGGVFLRTSSNPASILQALDVKTGAVMWEAPGGTTHYLVDDAIYVRDKSTLRALDATTGARRWTVAVTGDPFGFSVEDGLLLVQEEDRLVVRGASRESSPPAATQPGPPSGTPALAS